MKDFKNRSMTGITLIALVITIIILLILAGVAIASLGENGLLARAKEAKKAQIEAEMEENLELAIQELQIEKLGGATLDDITEEWLKGKIPEDYKIIALEDDPTTGGKKVVLKKGGVTGTFLIDLNLRITKIENEDRSIQFTYTTGERDGNNVKITIKVQAEEIGINKIEIQDKEAIEAGGTKEEITIEDCEVELGKEYNVIITLANGEIKEKTILINEYYHKVTKNLAEGVKIDNTAVKAAYNQPYQAKITAEQDYAIETLTVTMGGTPVTVDKTTGAINIEKVTGDIEIKATAIKVEIQTTTPIIGTTETATTSVNDNSQIRGTTLYINFSATVRGTACTILNKDDNQTVPYAITKNGTYTFIATGEYNGKILTKEIEIVVNKYEKPSELVQYDAGIWTQKEIDILNNSKLYDFNKNRTTNSTFKLSDDTGLNFTFGGFEAGMSRNTSISPGSGYGTPRYDGWQVFESRLQDGKIYVTKLVHAGTPENFVFYNTKNNDSHRAEYLLSNGERESSYKKLSDGTTINPRNWDMYKDKALDDKGYIKGVHAMMYSETIGKSKEILMTRSCYYLSSYGDSGNLRGVGGEGNLCLVGAGKSECWGIRPVVELNDGVYIASGSGTEADPYILGKD